MQTTFETEQNANSELTLLLVNLLKGVQYQENDPGRWNQLLSLQSRVRDYVAVLGLELMLDEAEGYAFLRTRPQDDDDEGVTDEGNAPPRLVARRPLSFPVSLLLALLRKKLAETDAGGGDTRLILSRDEILELIRVFLPASSNEAKLVDQLDRHINKVIELGFLRRLQQSNSSQPPHYEVRRIIKAFVDAQWLADFDQRLAQYQAQLAQSSHDK
ncbi:MAG: DUF4194 domain-containing protein [Gammaproteobacteria bacterium]